MALHRAVCLLAVLALAGCPGRYGGVPRGAKAKAAPGDLSLAALPYSIVNARTGRQVDTNAFWDRIGKARAICVGEDHTNPHHHWMQLEITKRIAKTLPPSDRLALGLEMIQRPFQGVLEDYAQKRIDSAALRSRAGWDERWGYDWGFYGPTIDTAVAAGAYLLALNAARELTKKVVRKGLEGLAPEERAQVPELDLDDKAHRAWFDGLMESMGGSHAHSKPEEDVPRDPHDNAPLPDPPGEDRIYTVQVIWDETMAETTANWLAANPNGHVIVLAGNGHCHDSAIVNRIKRRGIADVISVRPVIDIEGQVAGALAKPVNDFVVVLQMPNSDAPAAPPAH